MAGQADADRALIKAAGAFVACETFCVNARRKHGDEIPDDLASLLANALVSSARDYRRLLGERLGGANG